jgi:cell division protein ZipA
MTELQWALVIVGVAAVIGVYLYSRRDRDLRDWRPPNASDSPLKPKPPTREQMEMFQSSGNFDEWGVGKPRSVGSSRREPELSPPSAEAPKPPEARLDKLKQPARVEPAMDKARPAAARHEEKYVALLIAEREGTNIFGEKLHAALRAQKLEFGARQIYHRLEQGTVQFSVASLLQPGTLDPAQAVGFSTPGLTVFMVLPGPHLPMAAFDDMLATARALARALNAEVFDMQRQVLTDASARTLRAEVETWARGQPSN